jgi:hypothetical protein
MTDVQERFTVEDALKRITIDHEQYIEIVDQKETYKYYPYCTIVSRRDRQNDLLLQHFSTKTLAEAVEIANRMFLFIGPFEDEEITPEMKEQEEYRKKRESERKIKSIGIS